MTEVLAIVKQIMVVPAQTGFCYGEQVIENGSA